MNIKTYGKKSWISRLMTRRKGYINLSITDEIKNDIYIILRCKECK